MGRPGWARAGPGGCGLPGARREQRQQRRRPRPAPPGPVSAPRVGSAGGRRARRGTGRGSAGGRAGVGDEQDDIPLRLREILSSRRDMSNALSGKRRRRAAQAVFRTLEEAAKGTEPDLAVPKFKRRKGESDAAFVQRMEQEAQHVLLLSRSRARRQPEAPAPAKKSPGKKAFRRRRLDRIRQRQAEKVAERLERELLQDPVKFGDVVLQPPELTARPRASTSVNQPGRKSLLLKTCLSRGGAGKMQPPVTSPARQRIVEAERERVVLAYRALKRQQQAARPPR